MAKRRTISITLALALATLFLLQSSFAAARGGPKILEFDTMVGVPAAFGGTTNAALIRNVPGGGLPWTLTSATGDLSTGAEGLRIRKERGNELEMVSRALSRAGLRPPERFLPLYPHEISGGQRQRVVIAGAMVMEPRLPSPTSRWRVSTHPFGVRSSP